MDKQKILKMIPLIVIVIAVVAYAIFGYTRSDISDYKLYESTKESLYPAYTKEELVGESNLIVKAKFSDYSDYFGVKPANDADISVFRDANFKIMEVYKGDLSKGDNISVRLEGGEYIDHKNKAIYNVHIDGAPEIDENNTIVLFLNKPSKGGGYNTKGDYSYLVGSNQGIFTESQDSKKLENKSRSELDLSEKELKDIIKDVPESLSEEDIMLDNFNRKYITEEEYNDWLNSRDSYAEILK